MESSQTVETVAKRSTETLPCGIAITTIESGGETPAEVRIVIPRDVPLAGLAEALLHVSVDATLAGPALLHFKVV